MEDFIKSDLPRLFRYTYSGFLMVALLTWVHPDLVKHHKDLLPEVVMCAAIVAAGACIFIFYRYVFGELILFNLVHFFSFLLSQITKKPWSVVSYLGSKAGVKFGNRRAAYTFLRESTSLLKDPVKNRLRMIHSEIHVLYVTVFELLVLCACGQFKSPEYLSIAVSFAMLTLLGALVFDLHQHRIEATQFRSIDLAELQTELRTAGLLQ